MVWGGVGQPARTPWIARTVRPRDHAEPLRADECLLDNPRPSEVVGPARGAAFVDAKPRSATKAPEPETGDQDHEEDRRRRPASLLAAPVALAAGPAETFQAKCAACHGKDGKGQSDMAKKLGVKDLTVTKLPAAEIEKVIANGKGKMTPWKGKLSDAEISRARQVRGGRPQVAQRFARRPPGPGWQPPSRARRGRLPRDQPGSERASDPGPPSRVGQCAPRDSRTAGTVRKQIWMSCQSDQVSMYSRSSFIHWSKEMSDRPLTCQVQVMPGFTLRRRRCQRWYLLHLGGHRRPGTDDAHLAGEDVQELGQLVERGPADEAADAGDARVVPHLEDRARGLVLRAQRLEAGLGVDVHAAELEHLERAPVLADPGLAEEDRARGLELDGDGGGDEGRREEEDRRRRSRPRRRRA